MSHSTTSLPSTSFHNRGVGGRLPHHHGSGPQHHHQHRGNHRQHPPARPPPPQDINRFHHCPRWTCVAVEEHQRNAAASDATSSTTEGEGGTRKRERAVSHHEVWFPMWPDTTVGEIALRIVQRHWDALLLEHSRRRAMERASKKAADAALVVDAGAATNGLTEPVDQIASNAQSERDEACPEMSLADTSATCDLVIDAASTADHTRKLPSSVTISLRARTSGTTPTSSSATEAWLLAPPEEVTIGVVTLVAAAVPPQAYAAYGGHAPAAGDIIDESASTSATTSTASVMTRLAIRRDLESSKVTMGTRPMPHDAVIEASIKSLHW